jgi:iron(III) transport system substrate-binding protein
MVACAAILLEAAMGLAGAATVIDDLIVGAKKERQVVLYSAADEPTLKDLKARFEKAYGVELVYLRLPSSPLSVRLKEEAGRGQPQADTFYSGDPVFADQLAAQGALEPLGDLPIPSEFPKDYVRQFCPVVRTIMHGIQWNTSEVPASAEPKGWNDLLGVISPRLGLGLQTWWFVLSERLGEGFFRRLGDQAPRVYQDLGAIQNDLAAGVIAIAVPSYMYDTQSLIERRAPVKAIFPDPTSGFSSVQCLMKGAAHPNAARLFMHLMLTRDGQTGLNGNLRDASPVAGIAGTVQVTKATVIPPPEDVAKARDRLYRLGDEVAVRK